MKPFPIAMTFAVIASLCSMPDRATADVFGSGDNTFVINFVPIGDPGNLADSPDEPVAGDPVNVGGMSGSPVGAGSVDYVFNIGKYEISRVMIDRANSEAGLGITMSDMTDIGGNGRSQPAMGIDWFEAARFVNWLNTSSGAHPAYKFDNEGNFQLWRPDDTGYSPNNLYRNSQARYFLPSTDEWYKAAYYDPQSGAYFDYATGSDTTPIPVALGVENDTAVYAQDVILGTAPVTQAGGLSPYGTMAQSGNVWEWEETEADLFNDNIFSQRGIRGGSWISTEVSRLAVSDRAQSFPSAESGINGFRVASVPEPSSLLLGVLAAVGLMIWKRSLR